MKEILHSLQTTVAETAEVPSPSVCAGSPRVHTSRTVISAGTEPMLAEFRPGTMLDSAREYWSEGRSKAVFQAILLAQQTFHVD